MTDEQKEKMNNKTTTLIIIILAVLSPVVIHADSTGENLLHGLYTALEITSVSLIMADYISSAVVLNMGDGLAEGNRSFAPLVNQPRKAIPLLILQSVFVCTVAEVLWKGNWIAKTVGVAFMAMAIWGKSKVLSRNLSVIVEVRF